MRPLVSLGLIVALSLAALATSSRPASAATPEEVAARLKSLGALLDHKPPTPELVKSATTASFDGVKGGVAPPDLAVLSALPKLTKVGLGNGAGTDANVAALVAAVPRLRQLSVHNSTITDAALAHIMMLSELEELVAFSTSITAAGMTMVAKLSNLDRLDVSGTAIGDAGLLALRGSGLSELTFNNMRGVTRAGLEHIAALRNLKSLVLQFAAIDVEIGGLAGAKSLDSLTLMASKLTDAGGVELAKLTQLTKLYLWSTKITDKTIAALAPLTKLTTLYVSNTGVTDACVPKLTKLTALEVLWADRTALGDAVAQLGTLPKLRWLKLDDTKVTDAAVDGLVGAPALTTLDLRKTSVSDAAVARFKAAHPKARVSK